MSYSAPPMLGTLRAPLDPMALIASVQPIDGSPNLVWLDGSFLQLNAGVTEEVDGMRYRVDRVTPDATRTIGWVDRLDAREWLPGFERPIHGGLNKTLGNGPLCTSRRAAALWLAKRDDKNGGSK